MTRKPAKPARPKIPPAFIDPPSPFDPIEEWLDYRASLDKLDLPYLGPLKREADREIARLRREAKQKNL